MLRVMKILPDFLSLFPFPSLPSPSLLFPPPWAHSTPPSPTLCPCHYSVPILYLAKPRKLMKLFYCLGAISSSRSSAAGRGAVGGWWGGWLWSGGGGRKGEVGKLVTPNVFFNYLTKNSRPPPPQMDFSLYNCIFYQQRGEKSKVKQENWPFMR